MGDRRIVLGALGALLAASLAAADRPTAEFFGQRAEKALQDRNWAEAESLYRRALEEDPTFLPARHGLGEALLGAGQRDRGIEELRRFCQEASALETVPPAWRSAIEKGKKRLAAVDTLGAEFDKMVSDHVQGLIAFAGRWREKDPAMAERALELALELRPEHAEARELLAKTGRTQPAGWTRLFNGRDLNGWNGMGDDVWSVEDGLLVAKIVDGSVLARHDTFLEGDFDVLIEAKLLETNAEYPMFAVAGAVKQDYVKSMFGVLKGDVVVWEYRGSDKGDEIWSSMFRNLSPPLVPGDWNRYEIRFRKGKVHIVLNGREIYSYRREAERDRGFVGVQVQDSKVAFRRIDYAQR